MLYNVVLVSAIQEHESAMSTCVPSFLNLPSIPQPHPTPLGYVSVLKTGKVKKKKNWSTNIYICVCVCVCVCVQFYQMPLYASGDEVFFSLIC